MDQGAEFGYEFQQMLTKNGIEHSASTSRNHQGNSSIKRTHQAIGQVSCTVLLSHDPKSVHEGQAIVQEVLATAMPATHCASSAAFGNNSPGALAFHRDMFLDVLLIADILTPQKHRQALVDK